MRLGRPLFNQPIDTQETISDTHHKFIGCNLPSSITHLILKNKYYNINFHNKIKKLPCNLSYLKINNIIKDIKTIIIC